MASHAGYGANAGVRTLVASLLLSDPIHIDASVLSDDVHMRQRMLGLPRTAPFAPDLEDAHTQWGDSPALQEAFIRCFCRDPIEVTESALSAKTARSFFVQRRRALDTAAEGERDPIDMERLTMLCKDEWHGTGRLLVQFPGDPDLAMLYMSVVRDGTEVKLDNLFALDDPPAGLHHHTPACWESYNVHDEDAPAAAEYINDADEFWSGFDDPAPAPAPAHAASAGVSEPAHTSTDADESAAIRDIVRGAYTLFRSRHPLNSTESFLELVHSAIAPQ
jgi:hypothetical protein